MFHSSNQPSRRGVLLICQISCLVTNMVSVYFDVSASNGKHYQQWCDVFKVNKKVFQIYSFYLPRKRRKELSTNYAKTESTVNFKPTGKQLSNACARKPGKLFNQWEGPQVSIIRVFPILHHFLQLFSGDTLGARDFSSAVSCFCQVFSRGVAARGFGLRPKMCRPSANTANSRRTREKPLAPRVLGGLMSQFSLASLHYYKWHNLTLWLMVFFGLLYASPAFQRKKLKNAQEEGYGSAWCLELTLTEHRSLGGVGWGGVGGRAW